MTHANTRIVQIAYIVSNVQEAIARWVAATGAGPFFVGNQSSIKDGMYRGQPSRVEFTFASGYNGDVEIELIEQHNDAPSVYRELIDVQGEGYHHFMPLVPDYDEALASYTGFGAEPAFTGVVPGIGRVAYLDGRKSFGGFVEILDMSPTLLAVHATLKKASVGWDGKDAVRPFPMRWD